MRLIECHIENFGKLSDYSVSFEEGCHVIRENNGWGKSTLAAFIKAMLYGFEGETKRDAYENERKRYTPWQGGVYGGQLTFETEGKAYTVFRVFGTKGKDDQFELRETATNLVSGQYPPQLGESLFQIDGASFARTVFLSQNDCETSVSAGIAAKIGDLAESADDMKQFERADKSLQELLNELTPYRKTGSLSRLSQKIRESEEEVRRREDIERNIEKKKAGRGELMLVQKQLIRREEELKTERRETSAKLDLTAKKAQYRRILEDYRTRKERLEERRAFFPGELPEEQRLGECLKSAGEAVSQRRLAGERALTEGEERELSDIKRRFPGGLPQKEELERMRDAAVRLQRAEIELASCRLTPRERESEKEYDSLFQGCPAGEEQIEAWIGRWRERCGQKDRMPDRKRTLEALENVESRKKADAERRKRLRGGLLLASLLLCAAGIVILSIYGTAGIGLLGVGLLGPGLILAGAVFVSGRRAAPKSGAESEEAERLALERELRGDEERIARTDEETAAFLARYGMRFREETADAQLAFLKNAAGEYRRLKEKKADLRRRREKSGYEELRGQIGAFLETYLPDDAACARKEAGPNRFGEASVQTASDRFEAAEGTASDRVEETEETASDCFEAAEGTASDRFKETEETASDRFGEALEEIREAKERADFLLDQQRKWKESARRAAELSAEVQEYLESLGFDAKEEPEAQLKEISERLSAYRSAKEEYDRIAREKAEFERSTDTSGWDGGGSGEKEEERSLEEIDRDLTFTANALEENRAGQQEYRRQEEALQEELDGISETESLLADDKEAYEQGLKKYRYLENTRRLLTEAKEAFTTEYMGPLLSAFRKYYAMLTGGDGGQYRIDADTSLTVMEAGEQREPRFFSAGYRDLIGICMRMSLIDAMYRAEKPFLVMDDPFVNLDEEKRQRAMRFLEEVSAEYQIIYLTCHENVRAPR